MRPPDSSTRLPVITRVSNSCALLRWLTAGHPLESPKGHDVHKRQRMFARHQGYVAGNVVLLHRACHELVHQREPHA